MNKVYGGGDINDTDSSVYKINNMKAGLQLKVGVGGDKINYLYIIIKITADNDLEFDIFRKSVLRYHNPEGIVPYHRVKMAAKNSRCYEPWNERGSKKTNLNKKYNWEIIQI